ncbi:conserved hypothetical protein [Culex quinquefasciatus]|uniref:Odorant-binding protein n=1 Tax=Culex quinquefasciatus TaxID=7176 RepID=B0XCB8_CULQU|nr:conserved hypothetical protein [Culex quinquefasciatus]|eukprot:XP_001867290.1 conserved hypothetical protein [Culex quinquefasciatus]
MCTELHPALQHDVPAGKHAFIVISQPKGNLVWISTEASAAGSGPTGSGGGGGGAGGGGGGGGGSSSSTNDKDKYKPRLHTWNECDSVQYLVQPNSCVDRCELLVQRSWNDSSGVIWVPYGRHFAPSCDDHENDARTWACIQNGSRDIAEDDVCRRAAVLRRCFCQNYGEIVQAAQLVPRTELEVASILQECIEFLQVSPDELDDYVRYNFQLNEQSRCLMRCVIIRQGLYDDERGPDLDRMYVQCGGYDVPEEEFKASARKCINRLTEEFRCDKCALAARIVAECFPQESGPLFATIVAANLLKFKIRKTVKFFKKAF